MNPKKSRKKSARTAPRLPDVPPDLSQVLPPALSDEQRRVLRARQLMGGDQSGLQPNHALPDRHLQQDMEVQDPRGAQFNQVDGRTVFPMKNGPRLDRQNVRILPESDLNPGLPNLETPELNRAASLDVVAGVSAGDHYVLGFDNAMTEAHTVLQKLRQAAEGMAHAVEQQDDDPAAKDSATSYAHNIVQMLAQIVEPWFNAVDDEFTKLLNETDEQKNTEEE